MPGQDTRDFSEITEAFIRDISREMARLEMADTVKASQVRYLVIKHGQMEAQKMIIESLAKYWEMLRELNSMGLCDKNELKLIAKREGIQKARETVMSMIGQSVLLADYLDMINDTCKPHLTLVD